MQNDVGSVGIQASFVSDSNECHKKLLQQSATNTQKRVGKLTVGIVGHIDHDTMPTVHGRPA